MNFVDLPGFYCIRCMQMGKHSKEGKHRTGLSLGRWTFAAGKLRQLEYHYGDFSEYLSELIRQDYVNRPKHERVTFDFSVLQEEAQRFIEEAKAEKAKRKAEAAQKRDKRHFPVPVLNRSANGSKKPAKRKIASATIFRDIHLGDAPAGMPCLGAFRPDAWEEKVRVNIKKHPLAAFALRVRGESMIGKGIKDGDILIFAVPDQCEPQADDVVAVHIEDEVTIKTLVKRNGKSTLRAENPAYPNPKVTKNSAVQGVMIGKL